MIQKTEFYQYYDKLAIATRERNARQMLTQSQRVPYGKIVRKIWPMLFCIWLNFHNMLSIFPVYQLNIVPSTKGFLGEWYYDIIVFLSFNVFVLAGNMLPRFIRVVNNQINLTIIYRFNIYFL